MAIAASPARKTSGGVTTGLAEPVALVGFGVEGRETLAYLLGRGAGEVRVFDRGFGEPGLPALRREFPGVGFFGGDDWAASLGECKTIFRSPGVRPDLPALRVAQEGGARVTSATGYFLANFPGRCVGVTGTVGKGTTASLIAAALGQAGIPHRLGGNIGVNPLSFLAGCSAETVAVLELSSFQLMDLAGRRPPVAVVLRTTSEHMDWHHDLAEYRRAKQGLLAPPGQPQQVIYCADSEGSAAVAAPRLAGAWAVSLEGPVADGVGMEGGTPARFRAGRPTPLPGLARLALPGRFNLENAAAAWLAVEALGAAGDAAAQAIAAFAGLPHRLEKVGEVGGVACYNDSYATRPEATLGALGAFDAPVGVILGGSEKFADFSGLAELLCRHPSLRRVVLIGATAERLAAEIADAGERLGVTPPAPVRAAGLEQAFRVGLEGLGPGGVLLFSPACASFDMFPNYKVRGERFRALVAQACD